MRKRASEAGLPPFALITVARDSCAFTWAYLKEDAAQAAAAPEQVQPVAGILGLPHFYACAACIKEQTRFSCPPPPPPPPLGVMSMLSAVGVSAGQQCAGWATGKAQEAQRSQPEPHLCRQVSLLCQQQEPQPARTRCGRTGAAYMYLAAVMSRRQTPHRLSKLTVRKGQRKGMLRCAGGHWKLVERHLFGQPGATTCCADLHHGLGIIALGLSNGTFRLYQVLGYFRTRFHARLAILPAASMS